MMTSHEREAQKRLDDAIRAMSPAERMAIVDGMWRSARRMIWHHQRSIHPDWADAEVDAETARRLASTAAST